VGTPQTLGGRDKLAATIRFTPPGGAVLPEALRPLVDPTSNGTFALSTEAPLHHLQVIAGWASASGFDLPDIDVGRPTLEDVYLALTNPRKEKS